MTMLDRMRRHKNWLKWSLAVVCLAFVLFYVPDFLRGTGADAAAGDVVARVESEQITAGEFRRTYQNQLQSYRTAYGGNMSEQLLRQLGVEQQILQQMVDERAALAEATRLGIEARDEEVREQILKLPMFQENGQFIGEQRYRQLLRLQRPPLTTLEFEESLRKSVIVAKLRGALTDWISIADQELEQEYKRRNEKVKLEIVNFSTEKVHHDVSADDAEVAAHYAAHKNDYRVGERRKVRYFVIDLEAIRSKLVIPPSEIERHYQDSIEQYSSPEQIRASHILLKTEGKDEAAVRAQAEGLLKEARGGADFAELATKHSEDEASAKQGGDLDYFGHGKMVPEFEQVAFSLAPGTMSDLVKTQYGFHIIKVVDEKPATTRTLGEVRQQIVDQISYERAQAQASDLAQTLEGEIQSVKDLERVATERGFKVQESGYFAKDEPIPGLGASPEAAARTFELQPGGVSGAVQVTSGFAFLAFVSKTNPFTPQLEMVKDRVREDVLKAKGRELTREKAAGVVTAAKRNGDLAAAAKAAGAEAKTSELIARGAALPEVGVNPAVDAVAFSLPIGSISDPIVTDNGTVVIRVVEREAIKPEDFAAAKDSFRTEQLADRRNRFFSAYLTRAKQRMKIDVNRDMVRRAVGT